MQWTKLTRVKWLRTRAEEVRRTANGIQHAESRGSLLQIAETYEKFARQRAGGEAWRRPDNVGPKAAT